MYHGRDDPCTMFLCVMPTSANIQSQGVQHLEKGFFPKHNMFRPFMFSMLCATNKKPEPEETEATRQIEFDRLSTAAHFFVLFVSRFMPIMPFVPFVSRFVPVVPVVSRYVLFTLFVLFASRFVPFVPFVSRFVLFVSEFVSIVPFVSKCVLYMYARLCPAFVPIRAFCAVCAPAQKIQRSATTCPPKTMFAPPSPDPA